MKKLILSALTCALFSGCTLQLGSSPDSSSAQKKDDTTPAAAVPPAAGATPGAASANAAPEMLGSFVGPFGDNKIAVLITKAADGQVSGRSIVGGNDRPFDGTYTLENGTYRVVANEPGDHKDDGVFKFSIAQASPDTVTGTWKANDTKRPEKSYTLQRRKFVYQKNVGEFPQASQRLLKAADVENMMKEDLTFMRNEIFARHGFCFSKKELRQQFEMEEWYVPNTTDIRGLLTDIEKQNIALIKRYEKYADEYGDEYGR